jgi:acetolactate synthase I/II/III large subunit
MVDLPVHEVLADAFAAEGVETVFALMGDANMYWATCLSQKHGVRLVHARHEHSAVAMADGYARATGRVGVATLTCGPAFTQILTALAVAVQRRVPMVVFAGDTPVGDIYHAQQLNQRPLAEAVGAKFIPLRSLDRLLADVQEAFYIARHHSWPVILSVPMDMQAETFPWLAEYATSEGLVPRSQRPRPDPEVVREAAGMLTESQRPILLAGEGAVRSGARPEIEELAAETGALLATTLRAKGMFDGSEFNIGVAGAFASTEARDLFSEADLVVGVGAGLGFYTTEGGYLYPGARTIQIDIKPHGLWQGLRVADLHMTADAKVGVQALMEDVRERSGKGARYRSEQVRTRIADSTPDMRQMPLEPDTLDPRQAVLELDRVVPKDWDVVVGVGHFFNWVTHLHGRPPERYHITHDFGAIGQGLPTAIGVAAARGDGKVLLLEGDGSLLMHIQELEVLARHNIQLLICILNDGAYGAEVHKLRAMGIYADEAIFGRTDLAGIARAFGLGGAKVKEPGKLGALFADHVGSGRSGLWDIDIAGNVPSAQYRRVYFGEA